MSEQYKLNEIRGCLHSTLACSTRQSRPLEPDYVCDYGRKYPDGRGPPCALLTAAECDVREQFPEEFDT